MMWCLDTKEYNRKVKQLNEIQLVGDLLRDMDIIIV